VRLLCEHEVFKTYKKGRKEGKTISKRIEIFFCFFLPPPKKDFFFKRYFLVNSFFLNFGGEDRQFFDILKIKKIEKKNGNPMNAICSQKKGEMDKMFWNSVF